MRDTPSDDFAVRHRPEARFQPPPNAKFLGFDETRARAIVASSMNAVEAGIVRVCGVADHAQVRFFTGGGRALRQAGRTRIRRIIG